ncbi:MAG TPA: hypothetical protein P5256_15925 [Beijerinckiaceae bacterium]|nr:hypothetical protein [Hyphomicrobiales bacterium]MCO5085976.1 hypothetical protein [Methylobacteriaceae bacterium]HRY04620.1 hypothetical protein [Beijerinckiaceae bacterium]
MTPIIAKLVRKPTADCCHPADRAYPTDDPPFSYALVTEVKGDERFVLFDHQENGAPDLVFYEDPNHVFDDIDGDYVPGVQIVSFDRIIIDNPRFTIADVDPWPNIRPKRAGFFEAILEETGDITQSLGVAREAVFK